MWRGKDGTKRLRERVRLVNERKRGGEIEERVKQREKEKRERMGERDGERSTCFTQFNKRNHSKQCMQRKNAR